MRTALFWAITQRVAVIPCGRFGTTYRSHLQRSRIQEGRFVNIITIHASNQQNANSTIETTAKLQKNETNPVRTLTQKRKAFNTQKQD